MSTDEASSERPMSEGDCAHVEAARWTPAHARLLRARIAAGWTPVDPPHGRRVPAPRQPD